jgi:hypothetical protein
MAKRTKSRPRNTAIVAPVKIEKENEKLAKRFRHIEAADAGQPGKFIKLDLKKIYRLCILGMTNRELADHYDVKYETWMAWLRPDSKLHKPELAATLTAGREDIVAKVADRLVQRAMGYKHKATKMFYNAEEDKVVKQDFIQRYPPSEAAAMFILKNKRPKDWKEKQIIEGPDGQGIMGKTIVNVITDSTKIDKLLKDKKEKEDERKRNSKQDR